MEFKLLMSSNPICKTCNKTMINWNPYTKDHEHLECASKRISKSILELVRKDLNSN